MRESFGASVRRTLGRWIETAPDALIVLVVAGLASASVAALAAFGFDADTNTVLILAGGAGAVILVAVDHTSGATGAVIVLTELIFYGAMAVYGVVGFVMDWI